MCLKPMLQPDKNKPIRVAVLQRVCAPYRIALFTKLALMDGVEIMLFFGDDVPDSKVKSASDLKNIPHKKLKTQFVKFGSRVLPKHIGLVDELKKYRPDAILCEGESHFLGYLQAIYYRWRFNKKVGLLHWCYIALPGESDNKYKHREIIKLYFRKYFDAFVLYSSYGKSRLLSQGQPEEKIFVATNVGDTENLVKLSASVASTKCEARQELNLPAVFTVLYLGTLETNKRPKVILDLARSMEKDRYNFVLLGSGSLMNELKRAVKDEDISNVHLCGRVVDELPSYLRASDVLLIPGRGGIVISEAMAFGIPVIVHEADGTEQDLVKEGVNGFRVVDGHVDEFRQKLEILRCNPKLCSKLGNKGREMIAQNFSTENMANQIVNAAKFAMDANKKAPQINTEIESFEGQAK